MNTETWKPAVDWEGIYEVSDLGRVKRIAAGRGTVAGKILSPALRNGYQVVHLRFNGREDSQLVHRLVALAFLPQDESRPFVNHKNGDRSDPRLTNLEWVTMSENHLHAFRELGKSLTGVATTSRGASNTKAKLTDDQVAEIRQRYATGDITQTALGAEYGISQGMVGHIVRRMCWTHI